VVWFAGVAFLAFSSRLGSREMSWSEEERSDIRLASGGERWAPSYLTTESEECSYGSWICHCSSASCARAESFDNWK
jgi:hypothetical protein